VIINITKTPNRHSTRIAALAMRISCVLGSINFHIDNHSNTTSKIRRIKDKNPATIKTLYPILKSYVKDNMCYLNNCPEKNVFICHNQGKSTQLD
jgi:hypothetical protein